MASVRSEYAKLANGLPALAQEFGLSLPQSVCDDVVDFTMAMECIDRVLDSLAAPIARTRFGETLMAALTGECRASSGSELDGHLGRLRDVIARGSAGEAFVRIARRALENTERMRQATNVREFIACVEEEGRLTVEMTLLVIGPASSAAFAAFLRSIAELANLVDKLLDARGDFRRGEIALRPGARLHARLLSAALRRVPRAAARHPSWRRFIVWGLGYLSPDPVCANPRRLHRAAMAHLRSIGLLRSAPRTS